MTNASRCSRAGGVPWAARTYASGASAPGTMAQRHRERAVRRFMPSDVRVRASWRPRDGHLDGFDRGVVAQHGERRVESLRRNTHKVFAQLARPADDDAADVDECIADVALSRFRLEADAQ